MKYIISALILSISYLYVSSQSSYESLIKNKAFVDIERETVLLPSGDYWEYQSLNKLIDILNNDLFSFFDLEEDYYTPLKKQNFIKTTEYQDSILPRFNQIVEKVKNAKFYALYNLRYNKPYDVSKHCFHFSIGVNDYNTTKTVGYIGLGHCFCVSYPTNLTKIVKNRTNYGDYFLQQFITTPTIPENVALKIENELENPYCSMCLLFVVKPQKISQEQLLVNYGGNVGLYNTTNFNILARTIELYIVDTENKEIIYDLTSVLQNRTTTKRKSK